jgi:hypothetical protein
VCGRCKCGITAHAHVHAHNRGGVLSCVVHTIAFFSQVLTTSYEVSLSHPPPQSRKRSKPPYRRWLITVTCCSCWRKKQGWGGWGREVFGQNHNPGESIYFDISFSSHPLYHQGTMHARTPACRTLCQAAHPPDFGWMEVLFITLVVAILPCALHHLKAGLVNPCRV